MHIQFSTGRSVSQIEYLCVSIPTHPSSVAMIAHYLDGCANQLTEYTCRYNQICRDIEPASRIIQDIPLRADLIRTQPQGFHHLLVELPLGFIYSISFALAPDHPLFRIDALRMFFATPEIEDIPQIVHLSANLLPARTPMLPTCLANYTRIHIDIDCSDEEVRAAMTAHALSLRVVMSSRGLDARILAILNTGDRQCAIPWLTSSHPRGVAFFCDGFCVLPR